MRIIKTQIENHNVIITSMTCSCNHKEFDELHNGYFHVDIYIDKKHEFGNDLFHCALGTNEINAIGRYIGIVRIEEEEKYIKIWGETSERIGDNISKEDVEKKALTHFHKSEMYKILKKLEEDVYGGNYESKDIEL